jgi:hypothetical protein
MYIPSSLEGPKGKPTGFHKCVKALSIRGIAKNNKDEIEILW